MSTTAVAIILTLIAANALYVAAEFAAVSARRSRIQQRAEDGNALARRLMPILGDAAALDRYIAACQIGITISSLVLGAYGQATLARALGPMLVNLGGMQVLAAESAAAGIVLVLLTILQMVLGELVPKSLALQFPTQTAMLTVIPTAWSQRLLSGFIHVLNGSGQFLLRRMGVPEAGTAHIHSPEEIGLLIAESRAGGLLEADEHKRLSQALRLAMRPVRELMIPRTRVLALEVDAPAADVLRVAAESPYTRLPVYEDDLDGILGFVHVRDLAVLAVRGVGRAGDGQGSINLRSLVRPIPAVPESITADRLISRLREERRQMALVVDEFGGTAGIVTIGDIVDELLGEQIDEFQTADARPERLPDGRVRLPGTLRVDEIAPWIGLDWSGSSYTVGGRVIEAAGRLPEVGDRIIVEGFDVEVERMEGHTVTSVLVAPHDLLPSRGPANADATS